MFTPCAVGYGQLLIIILVILLLFGGRKIPELMRGLGRGVKEFKDAVNKDYSAEETSERPADKSTRRQDPAEKEPEK